MRKWTKKAIYLLNISSFTEQKMYKIMRLRLPFSKCSSIEVTSCLSCRIHSRMLTCVVGKCTWRIFLNYSQVQKEQRVKMAPPCIFSLSLSFSTSLFPIQKHPLCLCLSLHLYNIKFPLQLKIRAKQKSGNNNLENILWWRPVVFQHVVTYNIAIGSLFLWMTANMLW